MSNSFSLRHQAADALVRLVVAVEGVGGPALLEVLAQQVAQVGPFLVIEVA